MKYNFKEIGTSAEAFLKFEETLANWQGVGYSIDEGEVAALGHAFIWDLSPQGHDFWAAQFHTATEEGREALAEMIAQAKEESAQ